MSIYKDAGHCISRVMSIEIHDGTSKPAWQNRFKASADDELLTSRIDDGLSPEERTTQDAMTRAMLKRTLADAQWHALAGKYSVNEGEVQEAARYLIPRVVSPAHHLFKTKCVMAWMVPERRRGCRPTSTRSTLGTRMERQIVRYVDGGQRPCAGLMIR